MVTIRFRGHPIAGVVIVAALAWMALSLGVGIDFAIDRHGAWSGTVVAVTNTWFDPLTLDFTPVKHLVVETPDGRRIDKMVTVENLAHSRIAVGDSVVKERGFGNHARVPGKETVAEMLRRVDP